MLYLKNKIVLVLCSPSLVLHNKYSSAAMVPQTGEIPLGLLYIASELEKHGFEVKVIDNTVKKLSDSDLAKEILLHSPILVGFSLLVLNVVSANNVAMSIKQLSPETVVVYGGPHATLLPQKQAEKDFVDIVVTHQGEITFRKIAENVVNGKFSVETDPLKKIIEGEKVDDLDKLSFPARHLVDINHYKRKSYVLDIEPVDFLCSSRGCPYDCTFCSSKTFWNRKYFKRSASNVVDEIELLVKKYNSKGIYFREDNFSVDRKHVIDICNEIIKRKLKIKWECESRVDTVDYETLKIMKKAGCEAIWCGIESGSQRILDYICKGYTKDQIIQFCKWCVKLKIDVGSCFIIGFPSEKEEDIIETFEFAKSLPVRWRSFVSYVGFPGSKIYDEIVEKKLWTDSWEDVLVARNEAFSAEELHRLEKAMNRDANKASIFSLRRYFRKVFFRREEIGFYPLIKKIRIEKGQDPENR